MMFYKVVVFPMNSKQFLCLSFLSLFLLKAYRVLDAELGTLHVSFLILQMRVLGAREGKRVKIEIKK